MDVEPPRNWPAFQLKPKTAEGSDRGESDPLMVKEGRPLLPRAGRILIRYGMTLPTLSVHHSTCVITCADVEPLRNWPAFQLKPKSEGSDSGKSDPFRWKEGRPLLSRAKRGLL